MMDSKMAGRELTCDEWALRLAQGVPHHERPEELLAIALKVSMSAEKLRPHLRRQNQHRGRPMKQIVFVWLVSLTLIVLGQQFGPRHSWSELDARLSALEKSR